MNYEEAKYIVTQLRDEYAGHNDERSIIAEALVIAMGSIEKQIPKKSTRKQRHRLVSYCPNCNDKFDYYEEKTFNYCSQCGQALDWSDEE